jgi:hypothetical protein
MYVSGAARRAYGRRMAAEEKRWRSLNGPVVVTRIERPALYDPPKSDTGVITETPENVDDANTCPPTCGKQSALTTFK